MSSDPPDEDEDSEKPPSSRRGYGNPPAEHRFKKGQSGNPRGRPRKVKASGRRDDADFGTQLANALLLEEAYRLVTVREGGKTFQLPTIQAICRGLALSAMTGNRLSQKAFIEQVRAVEAVDRKERLEEFEAAAEYKSHWELEIERAQQLRLPEPQPVPHPDDVFLDFGTGATRVCGPMTNQEKASWDTVLAHRDQIQAEVSRLAKAHRKARSQQVKALTLESWLREQGRYDALNNFLPPRYQRELENRCRDGGGSSPA